VGYIIGLPYSTAKTDYEGYKKLRALGSRGCPFSCAFCHNPYKTWRGRSATGILNELKNAIDRYKCQDFMFVDAMFNLHGRWVREICAAITAAHLCTPWKVDGLRADKLSLEICSNLIGAGCYEIGMGVETLHTPSVEYINKKESPNEILQGLNRALHYPFKQINVGYIIGLPYSTARALHYPFKQINVGYIIGLPYSTAKTDYEGYKKLRALGSKDKLKIKLSLAVPYTGTPMAAWVDKNAIRLQTAYDSCTRGAAAKSSGVAFETPEYSKEERLAVFTKLNAKEGRYTARSSIHRALTPVGWVMDALKYDPSDILWHINNIKKAVKTANPTIVYERIPNGTWYIC
jgi:radical SAM superfamily enzyme YgiQ (UPF0313 family)